MDWSMRRRRLLQPLALPLLEPQRPWPLIAVSTALQRCGGWVYACISLRSSIVVLPGRGRGCLVSSFDTSFFWHASFLFLCLPPLCMHKHTYIHTHTYIPQTLLPSFVLPPVAFMRVNIAPLVPRQLPLFPIPAHLSAAARLPASLPACLLAPRAMSALSCLPAGFASMMYVCTFVSWSQGVWAGGQGSSVACLLAIASYRIVSHRIASYRIAVQVMLRWRDWIRLEWTGLDWAGLTGPEPAPERTGLIWMGWLAD
ncbi:hypothetical protein IWX46DRAFT_136512 [Phyllosticta citricarpa]|uniref:Uncharacterized protein n=1 Tax=Phyllosticta citricarpa TaxID=55181 RepID=A0ABR1MRQ3_9PEZI